MLLLDDCSLESKLGGTDRSDVTARTGADDDDVEGGIRHGLCFLSSIRGVYQLDPPVQRTTFFGAVGRHRGGHPDSKWRQTRGDDAMVAAKSLNNGSCAAIRQVVVVVEALP